MTTAPPRRQSPRAIDFHAHWSVPEVMRVTLPHSLVSIPLDAAAPQTDETRAGNNAERRRVMDHLMSDTTERVALMDRMGVAMQVLTASLVHQATDMLPLEDSVRLERLKNDRMSAVVKANPAPLHRARRRAASGAEARRRRIGALRRGAWPCGVQISTFYAGRELGHRDNEPFWAKAEELGARIYIHPSRQSRSPRSGCMRSGTASANRSRRRWRYRR